MPQTQKQKLAVIGSGISGMASAWLLRDLCDVTVFEKQPRLGGHANTVDIDYDGKPISVDTGFIVYNERTYPNLTRLFRQLGVNTETSEMSFAISCKNRKLEYGTRRIGEMLGIVQNAANPMFWIMIAEILRFYNAGKRIVAAGKCDPNLTLGAYFRNQGYGQYFINYHILPMAAAVWSTPADKIMDFPLIHFLNFCDNHGLLNVKNRPQWRTVSGGSKNYIEKIFKDGKIKTHVGVGARYVTRGNGKVQVTLADQTHFEFDRVIVATHPDQALRLLRDAEEDEQSALEKFRYTPNIAYLHRDARFMPRRKSIWSSWNYLESGGDLCVTYWMNCLQNLDRQYPLFVTLNPTNPPDAKLIFKTIGYEHPAYNTDTFIGQNLMQNLQGKNNTWFAGAYMGFGFHEDGLNAAIRAAHGVQQTLLDASEPLDLPLAA